jgi:hypothetical protein
MGGQRKLLSAEGCLLIYLHFPLGLSSASPSPGCLSPSTIVPSASYASSCIIEEDYTIALSVHQCISFVDIDFTGVTKCSRLPIVVVRGISGCLRVHNLFRIGGRTESSSRVSTRVQRLKEKKGLALLVLPSLVSTAF